ncbi:hypothetical protein BKA93DRAFT_840913 [Sparassis latifolia]
MYILTPALPISGKMTSIAAPSLPLELIVAGLNAVPPYSHWKAVGMSLTGGQGPRRDADVQWSAYHAHALQKKTSRHILMIWRKCRHRVFLETKDIQKGITQRPPGRGYIERSQRGTEMLQIFGRHTKYMSVDRWLFVPNLTGNEVSGEMEDVTERDTPLCKWILRVSHREPPLPPRLSRPTCISLVTGKLLSPPNKHKTVLCTERYRETQRGPPTVMEPLGGLLSRLRMPRLGAGVMMNILTEETGLDCVKQTRLSGVSAVGFGAAALKSTRYAAPFDGDDVALGRRLNIIMRTAIPVASRRITVTASSTPCPARELREVNRWYWQKFSEGQTHFAPWVISLKFWNPWASCWCRASSHAGVELRRMLASVQVGRREKHAKETVVAVVEESGLGRLQRLVRRAGSPQGATRSCSLHPSITSTTQNGNCLSSALPFADLRERPGRGRPVLGRADVEYELAESAYSSLALMGAENGGRKEDKLPEAWRSRTRTAEENIRIYSDVRKYTRALADGVGGRILLTA